MTASPSSTTQPKATRAASPKKTSRQAAKKATAPKSDGRSSSARGRSRAAEMLREIQIDGKALSVQIERLRSRFL
jgi:hypothetical protein